MMSQSSQVLADGASVAECRTMTAHLASERPKPARAPLRPATLWQKQTSTTNPTQLKKKAAKCGKHYCYIIIIIIIIII